MIVPDLIKAVKAGQTKAKVEIQEKCFMNKRLQELYLVASEQFKIVQDQGLPAPYQTRAFAEKFAELIVRECISKIEDELANARCVEPREWGYVSGLSVATEIILQQFGSERMKQAVYVGKVNDETGELE